jgi:hypothetical protein
MISFNDISHGAMQDMETNKDSSLIKRHGFFYDFYDSFPSVCDHFAPPLSLPCGIDYVDFKFLSLLHKNLTLYLVTAVVNISTHLYRNGIIQKYTFSQV